MNTKILIVEDDGTLAMHLERLLSNWGYETVMADSGETALELAGDEQPDLVLMDIHLDDDIEAMDGIDAARELRARFDIPSIYLTAYAGDDFFQRAKQTEPYGYLVKPLQELSLQSTLEMAVYMAGINAERKQMEQRLEASLIDLELAQRIAHVGNWTLDPAVGVPTWSDEVYRIYERDPALGPPPVEDYKKIYAPDQYNIFFSAIQRAIKEGKPYDIQLHLTLPGGKTKWVHAVCRPDPNLGPSGHFLRGTIQDVTEIKHAEEQLQAYSQRLEEMVAERARELEAAQEELIVKERLAVLGHLAGSIAHELRNPLAVIDSAVYLLNMKLKNTDEKINECFARISGNVKKSTDIIESLLNLSRMEKPKTDKIKAGELISEVIRSSKIPGTVQTVKNLPEEPVFIAVDPEQIRMALKNLVRNAVQAMDENGKLTISAKQTQVGHVELTIADTGPGIAPEHIEKVFEPLFSTKTHGIGFGLSITKMIVENHGGTIRADSKQGEGAVFTLTLPLVGYASMWV